MPTATGTLTPTKDLGDKDQMGKPAALETPPPTLVTPETIGQQAATIPVELSTRFLEHFSEQLYSSPQKAFEELISNGWDAGADCVDVRIPTDLAAADATILNP